jgi:hypothetical protein
MLPVPGGRSRHANLTSNIFLVQFKLKLASAQVITEGDGSSMSSLVGRIVRRISIL